MIGLCPKCRGELKHISRLVDKKIQRTVVCKDCGYDLSSVKAPIKPIKRRRK